MIAPRGLSARSTKITGARADFYIRWRAARGERVQHDRWDDLRHCINSACADVFVTGDKALKAAFEEINPGHTF